MDKGQIRTKAAEKSKRLKNAAPGKILGAAEKLFGERGYDGVSVSDVARKAGVNKALVFYYYESKDQLYDEILDLYYKAHAAALLGAMSDGGTSIERLHRGVDAYIDFLTDNTRYAKLIQREVCSGGRILEKIAQYMSPLEAWGGALVADSAPGEGPLSARQFFFSFFGMIVNYFTYAPALAKMWDADPLSAEALDERRRHIHWMIDAVLHNLKNEVRREK